SCLQLRNPKPSTSLMARTSGPCSSAPSPSAEQGSMLLFPSHAQTGELQSPPKFTFCKPRIPSGYAKGLARAENSSFPLTADSHSTSNGIIKEPHIHTPTDGPCDETASENYNS